MDWMGEEELGGAGKEWEDSIRRSRYCYDGHWCLVSLGNDHVLSRELHQREKKFTRFFCHTPIRTSLSSSDNFRGSSKPVKDLPKLWENSNNAVFGCQFW
jgi:hypothetical protein